MLKLIKVGLVAVAIAGGGTAAVKASSLDLSNCPIPCPFCP